MIKVTLEEDYCVVEPQGPLSKEDFASIASKVDPVIEGAGELSGLTIKTRDFPGWESLGDVVAHFRFVKNHHQAIKKVALVTDAKLAEFLPALVDHFVSAEVKHFDFDDFDDAIDWVS
jgi:hypothetical protein